MADMGDGGSIVIQQKDEDYERLEKLKAAATVIKIGRKKKVPDPELKEIVEMLGLVEEEE